MFIARFIKSDLLNSLSDDVINQTCQQFNTVPDGCSESYQVTSRSTLIRCYHLVAWLFELVEGAISDTTTSCLPKSHREALYTVAALHQWPVNVPQEDVRCVLTARDWIDKVIHVESPGGPLPCVSVFACRSTFELMTEINSFCRVLTQTLSVGFTVKTLSVYLASSNTSIRTTFSVTVCGQLQAIEAIS
jgi:hypothetical protein